MGLADMLIKLGLTYGSISALGITQEIYKTIAQAAIEKSLSLAINEGMYPECNPKLLSESSFINSVGLSSSIIEDISKYGLHNSQLLTCAPTGSIATMLQVSTGVEPNFALHYTRKTQSLNGTDTYYEVNAKIVEDYYSSVEAKEKSLPEYFVESKDIAPIDRIKMQGVLQKYTDASISSTINLPKESTIDDVYNIYLEAWKNGLKGVTVYRNGCYREGILTTEKPIDIPNTLAPKRPEDLECDCYTIKSQGENFVVCVGLLDNQPYEVFVFRLTNWLKLPQHKGTITKVEKSKYRLNSEFLHIDNLLDTDINVEEKAATLYSSMLLRHGINIKYIIKTAKKVNQNITSFSSAMCRVLSKYVPVEKEGKCPECGSDLIHEGGCTHCTNCEWSRCE